MNSETRLPLNFRLAFALVRNSIRYHRLVSLATILGVATGMCVVSSILIVDHNTARPGPALEQLAEPIEVKDERYQRTIVLPIVRVDIIKAHDLPGQETNLVERNFPNQELETAVTTAATATSRGEEDYQAMRLAIRMASMFAFFIGSVIVFYTMRFSVALRIREFALMLCLGEHQRNVALSLVLESVVLGATGTLLGLLSSYPAARVLLALGISTTGREPSSIFLYPAPEIVAMVLISLLIVLLGVISPVRTLYRLQVAQALQPRFMASEVDAKAFMYNGYSWLVPPVLLGSWLAVRPFLENWLSVVYFFALEAVFIVVLTFATIWLTRPFLRLAISLIELGLNRVLPLETLLSVRRIRLTSQRFVFSITGVILVFSMLSGLHAITRTLKHEIHLWSSEAITPYLYYERISWPGPDEETILDLEARHHLHLVRFSDLVRGSLPMRLVHSEDFNRYREARGLEPFGPEHVIFSRTLAERFGVQAGDHMRIDTTSEHYEFKVLEVSDGIGTFAENAQYVDIKSFALFTNGNALFSDNLELTLGNFAVARSALDDRHLRTNEMRSALEPYYQLVKSGANQADWQLQEINMDFLIFDFILIMTVILASIGIVNTLLIQVHSRGRELSVIKTLGVDRGQMIRLLLAEGLVIGLVGGTLAQVLGTALGVVSVSFLDRFTLFEYTYVWSGQTTALIFFFALVTCCASAVYPAIVATRISTAESLHYE
jgi:putative ABC transport system permease protein